MKEKLANSIIIINYEINFIDFAVQTKRKNPKYENLQLKIIRKADPFLAVFRNFNDFHVHKTSVREKNRYN